MKTVKIGDNDITIKKFKVKQVLLVVSIASKLEGINFSGNEFVFAITGLIEENFDKILELISSCTNLTDEQVQDMDLEDMIDLISEIYEVNKGFFEKLSSQKII